MRYKKVSALVITGALIASTGAAAFGADYKTSIRLVLSGGSASTADVYDEAYTLTIPEALTITQEGWNSIGYMTASYGGTNDGFDPDKKLVVTAASTTGFNLTADGISDTIDYTIKTNESDTEATTTFEFTAEEINTSGGTSKGIGVSVGSFTGKSSATYTDTITYTVEVQSTITTTTVTWYADDITSQGNDTSFSRDGVIITAGNVDFLNKSFNGGGTFTTTLGNFTKIEVSASGNPSGTGWSGGTWTGTASNSVAFSGTIRGISTIVFTIEQ